LSQSLTAISVVRERFARCADGLAVALAMSLPWSTSATGILAAAWLVAVIPTLERQSFHRIMALPAGWLAVLLVALGALGMLWAEVPWVDRLDGVEAYLKLLFVPLLLHHFSRSEFGRPVLIGFLVSCVALLALSWTMLAWPGMPWPGQVKSLGVPVKDYISQGAMFTLSIMLLAQLAYDGWRDGRRRWALLLMALAVAFLANLFYAATSRTSLVVIVVLLLIFGYRQFGWKGAVGLVVACVLLAAAAWPSASFLRFRVGTIAGEIMKFDPGGSPTAAGERMVYWQKSVRFIREAPLIGHGTDSIRAQFRRAAVGQTGMAAQVSSNPHNQLLAVGIQLGFVGMAVLLAMWLAHLALFRSASFASWAGLIVVVQTFVGSLFNSHLFDFTHGWVYVVGVGIAGGTVLREAAARR
jgi:O-antigen ligase